MALQTFDEYLQDCLKAAESIRTATEEAAAIVARHTANDMGAVTDFIGRPITEAQYDGLITVFGNMTGFWGSPGFNGGPIEAALTEKP